MPPDSPKLSWFNQLQISSAEKNTLKKIWKLCPPPFLIFLATPLQSLVVGEENLIIGFAPTPPPPPPTLEMLPPLLVAAY